MSNISPTPPAMPNTPKMQRIHSLDMLRGFALMYMIIDHVRDNIARMSHMLMGSASPIPLHAEQLASTTPAIFWMRVLGHPFATGFLFLAGTSIYLWRMRRGPEYSLRKYLLARGAMVAGLNFLLYFNAPFSAHGSFTLHVLWPMGIAMMLIGLIGNWPRKILWILATGLIAGQNIFENISFNIAWLDTIWSLLFKVSDFYLPWGAKIDNLWQIGPWFAVMLLGYLSGGLFMQKKQLVKRLLCIGAISLAAFFIIRLNGWYGDPEQWVRYSENWKTIASFFNLSKYPPSFQFFLITFAIMCFSLAALERTGFVNKVALTFGGVPLFFYVMHLALIRVSKWVLLRLPDSFSHSLFKYLFTPWGILLASVAIGLMLYPMCAAYKRIRGKRSKKLGLKKASSPQ